MLGFIKRLGMLIGGMVAVPVGITVVLWPIWGWEMARTSGAPEIILVPWAIGVVVVVLFGLIAIDTDFDDYGERLLTTKETVAVWVLSPFMIVGLAVLACYGVCYGLFRVACWLVVGEA
jgi:hypothetical protein